MYARALSRRRPGQRTADMGRAARRRPGAGEVRRRQVRGHRTRDEPRRGCFPCTPIPCSRTRSAPPTVGHSRSTPSASARSGRASARWPRPTLTRGSASRARAHEIVTPSPANRMVSFPYPKLCTANMQVDQGAGYIVCSVEAARAGRGARGPMGLPTGGGRRQRPLVHLQPGRAPPLPRHPPGRAGRAGAGGARHRRRRTRRPLFVFPCGGADGGGRARAARGRSGPAADLDRGAHVRRRARQQLHLARHRPGGHCAAGDAGFRRAGDRSGVVRDEALRRRVRLASARTRRRAVRVARRPARSGRVARTCASIPRPPARSASRPTR